MSKVFLVVSKSFGGKDTFMTELLLDKEFCEENSIEAPPRLTTRKQRAGEIHGDKYYFQSDKEFDEDLKDYKDQIVVEKYDTEYGILRYASILPPEDGPCNFIYTADPEYLDEYKRILGDRLCVIYLAPPNYVLLKRFSERKENSEYTDKKWKEIGRRFMDDMYKFGLKSNYYLGNCHSIINLGEEVYINSIKQSMKSFLENDEPRKECTIFNNSQTFTIPMSNKNSIFKFDNSKVVHYMTIKELLDGDIFIRKDFKINTEKSKCSSLDVITIREVNNN